MTLHIKWAASSDTSKAIKKIEPIRSRSRFEIRGEVEAKKIEPIRNMSRSESTAEVKATL